MGFQPIIFSFLTTQLSSLETNHTHISHICIYCMSSPSSHPLFVQTVDLHDYHGRKSLAVSIVGTVVEKSTEIPSADDVSREGSRGGYTYAFIYHM